MEFSHLLDDQEGYQDYSIKMWRGKDLCPAPVFFLFCSSPFDKILFTIDY